MSVYDLFSLAGKTALITGGRRGIGEATALLFAEAGADVAVCDVVADDGMLQGVADAVSRLGRQSLALRADVSRPEDIEDMFGRVLEKFGRIDILVNSAAVSKPGRLLDMDPDDWDLIMNTNLKGVYLCCRTACRHITERTTGNIINICSVEGFMAVRDHANPYAVSKAGLMLLTRGLSRELGSHRIRVNAVAPGSIKTGLAEHGRKNPERDHLIAGRSLKGRQGERYEVANVALFLASDASSWVHGEVIVADGGLIA